jgi:hypothetical protein
MNSIVLTCYTPFPRQTRLEAALADVLAGLCGGPRASVALEVHIERDDVMEPVRGEVQHLREEESGRGEAPD